MKLAVVALAKACGILWGGCILFVGVIGQFSEGYGQSFQAMVGGVYLFYDGNGEMGDLLIGTVEGVVDGAIGGALLALLYNCCSGCYGKKDSA